ncbi:MAG TPA: D-alanyl-D-alanine carboxypeptidase, partial [Candidatus Gracilibacteria bacterium]|nr:D-alanyl-D-alanine carboxypeptidase [Candidatus Gracilibacteria bacterium]
VREMNLRAQTLNLKNTNFKNPEGLDEEDHYSSANDLLVITQALWKYPFFRQTVNTKETIIKSLSGPARPVKNTNKFLSSEVQGIKTGTTDLAGQCLLLYLDKDGHQVFTIVLGSQDRYYDSRRFIEDIWEKITW